MELHWGKGIGPANTQELAILVLAEKQLGYGEFCNPKTGLRCVWGVIGNSGRGRIRRELTFGDSEMLWKHGCSTSDNDRFEDETPKARCERMALAVAKIP